MISKAIHFLIFFTLLLAACASPVAVMPDTAAVATLVALQVTQTAGAQSIPTQVVIQPAAMPTPASSVGAISGTLAFPSESIPALLIVAFNQTTGTFVAVESQINQGAFRLENLTPGIYRLVAYLKDDPSRAGGYTQFVLCGLSVNCNDHSLIDIPVLAGQEAGGIHLADWYVTEPGFFPANPASLHTNSSISGQLSYPADQLPPLRVVAINVDNRAHFYFVDTQMDQSEYRLENLQPGLYYLIAYQREYKIAGGYTMYVVCGFQENCSDHSLATVKVDSGEQITNVDIKDWILAPGTYPEDPTP